VIRGERAPEIATALRTDAKKVTGAITGLTSAGRIERVSRGVYRKAGSSK
jgi:hypothetical protein